MEPTRVIAYQGYEIRFFVIAPKFGQQHFGAAYDIRRPDAQELDRGCSSGSIASQFITKNDAEREALDAARAVVDGDRRANG